MEPDTLNTCLTLMGQSVFYFAVIWAIDARRCHVYKRRQGGNPATAKSYAKLAVYEDAADHAEKVKRSQNYPNHSFQIKAENLTKVYDNGLLAVAGNSFGVKRGEVMGLLGPNGAGKTTTFNMMALQQGRTAGFSYI